MNPDLYAAWLTAGNNLQPAGAWLADWWPLLTAAAVLTVIGWAWRPTRGDDYRSRNDQRAAVRITGLGEQPEPGQPGSNEDDLRTCLHILAATDNARKEDR
jgi:hypothetical protein